MLPASAPGGPVECPDGGAEPLARKEGPGNTATASSPGPLTGAPPVLAATTRAAQRRR